MYIFLAVQERVEKQKPILESTTQKVSTKIGEHKKSIGKNISWVSKGTGTKLIGSFPSKNPRKAEATVKRNRKEKYGY